MLAWQGEDKRVNLSVMTIKKSEKNNQGERGSEEVDEERRTVVKGFALTLPAVSILGLGACGGTNTPDTNDGSDSDFELDADRGDTLEDSDHQADSDGFDGDPDADTEPDSDTGNCDPTRPDALGPFYVEGAPERTTIAEATEPGDRVQIGGHVVGPDCMTPVDSALIEIWHADADGVYHESTEDWRLRGVFSTDSDGAYQFESIRPGHYSGRPQHFHFRVSSPGMETLITQLYFEGDPLLHPNDSCQEGVCDSGDPARIINLIERVVMGERQLIGEFNIVLAAA